MKITQLHTLINAVTAEVLGSDTVVQEDLSNVVDLGKQIIDSDQVDNYVKKLVNHIGKVVFQNRLYAGGVPSVLMDSWEYASILEKVSSELPEAQENESYNLKDGQEYSPNTFYQPKVSAKFFNSKVTFEISLSFTDIQVKESFSSAEQLNGFISMLTTSVENSLTIKLDSLIMRTINHMTAETLTHELKQSDNTVNYSGSTVKAVNLLKLYNDAKGAKLKAENALQDSDFIRFATYQLNLYSSRMSKISSLFNVEGKARFTPSDEMRVVLLADFASASEIFLASNTVNPEKITLPTHDAVPYWQGSGLSYDFDDVSKLDVKTNSGNIVTTSGILGVMFDREALGVSNLDRRVTTNYNPKAEFTNNFYKFEAGYFNDLSENFVVFFVA